MALSEHQHDAMQAIFDFEEAVRDGGLSILSLSQVVKLAVADGHDMLLIALQMMIEAIKLAKQETN